LKSNIYETEYNTVVGTVYMCVHNMLKILYIVL